MFNNISYAQWLDMCIGAIIDIAGGDQVHSRLSDQALAEIKYYMHGVHSPADVAGGVAVIAQRNNWSLLA